MKKTALIVLILQLMISLSVFASDNADRSADRTIEKTIGFESGGEIKLENVNGRIEIVGVDKEEIKLTANVYVRKIKDSSEAKQFAEAVDIKIERRGRRVEITADIPKKLRNKYKGDAEKDEDEGLLWRLLKYLPASIMNGISSGNSHATFDYYLEVPLETDLEINNVNGNIEVSECDGKQDLNVVNGEIKLNGMRGFIDANLVNGAIHGNAISASMDGNTVNGNIKLAVVSGNLSLNTVNGDIEVKHDKLKGAEIDAGVMSGSITFKDADFRGEIKKKKAKGSYNGGGDDRWEFNCVNGNVVLTIINP